MKLAREGLPEVESEFGSELTFEAAKGLRGSPESEGQQGEQRSMGFALAPAGSCERAGTTASCLRGSINTAPPEALARLGLATLRKLLQKRCGVAAQECDESSAPRAPLALRAIGRSSKIIDR